MNKCMPTSKVIYMRRMISPKETNYWNYENKTKINKPKNPKSKQLQKVKCLRDIPSGPVVKNPYSNAGDRAWIPIWGTVMPMPQGNQACAPQLIPDEAK